MSRRARRRRRQAARAPVRTAAVDRLAAVDSALASFGYQVLSDRERAILTALSTGSSEITSEELRSWSSPDPRQAFARGACAVLTARSGTIR